MTVAELLTMTLGALTAVGIAAMVYDGFLSPLAEYHLMMEVQR